MCTLLEVNNKYNKGLICVVTQCFVAMNSLNVNRHLHEAVYTKLEKYSAEIDQVKARCAPRVNPRSSALPFVRQQYAPPRPKVNYGHLCR